MSFCRDDGRCKICDPPEPTRCDCRFHDDGSETTCGIHEPPALMYYDPDAAD